MNRPKIEFTPAFFDVTEIKEYYNKVNDDFSGGPYDKAKNKLGFQGCWDRPLHLEDPDNPVHKLFAKMQEKYGAFQIIEGSIRYLGAPFLPHTDVGAREDRIRMIKESGKDYGTYVIPLSWKEGYQPGTAFFSSPFNLKEDLYIDHLHELPEYSDADKDYIIEMLSLSVKEIYHWQNPGDLVAWHGIQWHSTTDKHNVTYTRNPEDWKKEFITIRVLYDNGQDSIDFGDIAVDKPAY